MIAPYIIGSSFLSLWRGNARVNGSVLKLLLFMARPGFIFGMLICRLSAGEDVFGDARRSSHFSAPVSIRTFIGDVFCSGFLSGDPFLENPCRSLSSRLHFGRGAARARTVLARLMANGRFTAGANHPRPLWGGFFFLLGFQRWRWKRSVLIVRPSSHQNPQDTFGAAAWNQS